MTFLSPAGSGKPVPKKKRTPTVTPEIMGSGETTKSKGGGIGQDTGRVVDITATEVKPDQLKGSKPKTMPELMPAEPSMLDRLLDRTKKKKFSPSFIPTMEPRREPKTQTEPKGGGGGKKPPQAPPVPTPGGGGKRKFSAFNSIRKFAKDNPAAALAAYDTGKGILSKIMKLRAPSVQGGRAIQVSAKQ